MQSDSEFDLFDAVGALGLATTAAGAVILTRSVDYGLQDARALYSKIEPGGTKGAGKTGIIEQHHLLPQQFKKQFEKA